MTAQLPYPPTNTPLINANTGQLDPLWSAFFDGLYSVQQVTAPGVISAFAGTVAPPGYLLCDGSSYDSIKYADLYKVIGTAYGSDGKNFQVPNMAGKFVRGGTPGATGGTDNVTLSLDQLPDVSVQITDPQHTHAFTGDPHNHTLHDPGHKHGGIPSTNTNDHASGTVSGLTGTAGSTATATTGITLDPATATGTNASSSTGISAELKGGGKAFDIIPSYVSFVFIIKY